MYLNKQEQSIEERLLFENLSSKWINLFSGYLYFSRFTKNCNLFDLLLETYHYESNKNNNDRYYYESFLRLTMYVPIETQTSHSSDQDTTLTFYLFY